MAAKPRGRSKFLNLSGIPFSTNMIEAVQIGKRFSPTVIPTADELARECTEEKELALRAVLYHTWNWALRKHNMEQRAVKKPHRHHVVIPYRMKQTQPS